MTTTDQPTRPYDPEPSTDRTIGALWDLAALADRLAQRAGVAAITAAAGYQGHVLQITGELGDLARVNRELGAPASLRFVRDREHYSWWVDSIEVVMVR